jgi:hypothetical protein
MAAQQLTSLSQHPRAAPAIRRVKAIAGLGGFALASLAGFEHGTPFATTMEHALIAGIVGNLVAWAVAVIVWKRLLVAQAIASGARRRRAAALEKAE